MMSFSATAAAEALARLRLSSSRFIPMTFVTCKHRAEAQGESRLTTEDLLEVREGLRFDSRGLRTLSSSKWMKSEGPTSLETELDLIGHLVAASVSSALAETAARFCSCCARRLTPASVSAQRGGGPRCAEVLSGSRGPPHKEERCGGGSAEMAQLSIVEKPQL